MRFQLPNTVVYWPPAQANAQGDPSYGAPVQLPARWEQTVQQTIDGSGNVVLSAARVYLASQALAGGLIWLGLLVNVPSGNPRQTNKGVREIISAGNDPSLDGRQVLYWADLK